LFFFNKNAQIKTGTVGVEVKILPPDVVLPDDIKISEGKNES